ncbi:MAG: DUF4097 family beta strand repeat-containing protein [Maribacter sp.]
MRFFILLFFTFNFLTAQKVVKKSIIDSTISSFKIDASSCYEINIETTDTDEVAVEATIDGEYKKDLVLHLKEEGSTVLISAGFQPNFENPNDKLSAHKVVSIALEIHIPAQKDVQVFGTNSNIWATGAYENLKITLNDGTSNLNNVKGKVEVASQSGDIRVKSESAEILSKSKYGIIDKELIPTGNNKYILNTVTGNILLKRIE